MNNYLTPSSSDSKSFPAQSRGPSAAVARGGGTACPRPASAGRESARGSYPAAPAPSRDAVGRHRPGALMRRWSRGATRITETELGARNRHAHFPAARRAACSDVRGQAAPPPPAGVPRRDQRLAGAGSRRAPRAIASTDDIASYAVRSGWSGVTDT